MASMQDCNSSESTHIETIKTLPVYAVDQMNDGSEGTNIHVSQNGPGILENGSERLLEVQFDGGVLIKQEPFTEDSFEQGQRKDIEEGETHKNYRNSIAKEMASVQSSDSSDNTDIETDNNLPSNADNEMEIDSCDSEGSDTRDSQNGSEILENGTVKLPELQFGRRIYIKQESFTEESFEQDEHLHDPKSKDKDEGEKRDEVDIDMKFELSKHERQTSSNSVLDHNEDESAFALSLVMNTEFPIVIDEGNRGHSNDKTGKSKELTDSSTPKLTSEKKRYECEFCQNTFCSAWGLKAHMRLHTGEKPYTCETCGRAFANSSNLTVHIRSHTGEAPYKCDICGKNFKQTSTLNVHKKIHEYDRPFKCAVCGEDFVRKRHLKEHIKSHKGQVTRVTKEIRTETGEVRYKCDVCDVTFKQVHSLKVHNRKHTGERPFECDICKMTFTRRTILNDHRRTHTGEKPFKCEICDMKFTLNSSLKEHIRLHTGEKPYKCDLCEMRFSTKNAYRTHKRKHTGDLFKCVFCDQQFTTRSALKLHERRKHASEMFLQLGIIPPPVPKKEKVAEKPRYKCETCGKEFIREYNFKQHLVTHTDEKFKCDLCGESFTSLILCQRHRRTHTVDLEQIQNFFGSLNPVPGTSDENPNPIISDENPVSDDPEDDPDVFVPAIKSKEKKFECEVCEKSFTSPSGLRDHIRIHTGKRPFDPFPDDKIVDFSYLKDVADNKSVCLS